MARPPPSTGGPPISFKTVPGRHRTQKWNVARQYDYSGDDWGGYDPYDDYGDQPPPPAMQQSGGPYGVAPPGPTPKGRQQSFDEGDERRAFSGPSAPGWEVNRSGSPAKSAVSSSSGGRPSGDYARSGRVRDFTNPEQVPPPLNTRGSPAPVPGLPATAPAGGAYPPRMQSASRGSPAPDVVPAPASTAPTSAAEKELPTIPFIRPSDIYKRMEAEREKERKNSMDSTSRPSLDASQEDTRDSSRQRPLSSVDEGVTGVEEDGPVSASVSGPLDVPHDFGEPSESSAEGEKRSNQTHALPPIQGVSGFGSSMFGSSGTTDSEQTPTSPPQTTQSTSSPLQATPTAAWPQPGADPAAEILAERTHETPIADIGRQPDELSHQASQASSSSQGFRSAVNRAFDQSELSRDSSQSTKQSGDVSRSNTTSTSGISPIMSKAPWSEQMAPPVPTIAEEYQGRASSESSRNVIPRKPSPQQSANASPRPSMEKGYRRSLDPPSSDNSPARTPGLESGTQRRLSGGFAAQTVTAAQAETETEQNELAKKQLEERMGRPRAGTDYSIRESDLAHAVNSSPDKGEFDAQAAQAERNEQDLFVQTHPPTPAAAAAFEAPASGRSSPAKSRVRDLADKYQDLHDQSRRGSTASSKSSWSNFRGSEENLPGKLAKRQNTNHSNMVSESDYGGVEEGGIRDSLVDAPPSIEEPPPIDGRPGLPSQQSFRPQLPGGWVSYSNGLGAGTPSGSLAPTSAAQEDTRASWYPGDDGPVDLTPTTRKIPLEGSHGDTSTTMLGQAKDAGTALGAALMSSVGLGHQTHDFGSAQPAQEVEVPTSDRRLAGETRGLDLPAPRPQFSRGDTDASAITTVSNVSVASRETSRPPTPPAKDSPAPAAAGYDRDPNYFSAPAIAPLRTSRSREASPEAPSTSTFASYNPSLQRDDSLRREIVRSLDADQQRHDDVARTQDALDAPDNAAGANLPANEIKDDSPSKPSPLRMLDQRFSWEQRPERQGMLDAAQAEQAAQAPMVVQAESGKEIGAVGGVPVVREPQPEIEPDIRPEMPYERPRSRGLHIVNASDDGEEDGGHSERDVAVVGAGVAGMAAGAAVLGVGGPVSPITKSQENLHLRAQQQQAEEVERTRDAAPSPISQGSGSLRLPSYYMQDSSALGLDSALSQQDEGEEGQADRGLDLAASAPEALPQPGSGRTASPTFLDASVPQPPEKETTSPTTAATSPTSPTTPSKQKIPPFREILAIKHPAARIRAYDSTRRTFADTDTGLANWLSGMLAQNPEYASLSTQPYAPSTIPTSVRGHKASPSLSKFAKPFASSSAGGAGGVDASASGGAGDGKVDMEKLQQRGKELMKGAGVLGGKAQAGAKGLLAKGRSRFGTQRESRSGGGGGKVPSPTTTFHMVPPAPTPTPAPTNETKPTPASASPHSPPADSALATPLTFAVALPHTQASSLYSSPERSQTHSPAASSSASGPLSRTLTRLRERSRSLSSSGRRSRSRPQSLLLLSSNHGSELRSVQDASPVAASGVAAPVAAVGVQGTEVGRDAAISPWSEPDELAALGAVGVGTAALVSLGGLPERLGVLPSPGADTFSSLQDSRDGAGFGSLGEGEGPESPTKVRSAVKAVLDGERERAVVGVDEATRGEPAVEGERDELYDATPKQVNPASVREDGRMEDVEKTPTAVGPDGCGEMTPTARKAGNVQDIGSTVRSGDATDVLTSAITTEVAGTEHSIAGAETEDADSDQPETKEPDGLATRVTDLGSNEPIYSPEQASIDGNEPISSPKPPPTEDIDPISRQSTGLLMVPAISEPHGGQDWEENSAVSSNNDFHDTKELPDETDKQSSRRSSVSSLGHDEGLDPEQIVMSSQAVPAGPSPEQSTLKPEDRSMNRPYQYGHAQDGRSKSYISLGQDSTGAPLQETLDIAHKPKQDSVDLSNLSGPLAGLLPQRQPAVRDVSGEHRPKRFSGAVKGRRPTLPSDLPKPTVQARAPAPSAISDHYGLEGLQDDAENVVVGELPPYRIPDKQEEKKAKRKSGFFEAFKSSPSVSKTQLSREGSAQRLDSYQSSSSKAPAKTATRTRAAESSRDVASPPQRASTTVKESEQKKKRFSGLGSIFGRSSTTGHKSEKPRKLMKQVPDREASRRESTAPRQATAPVPNFEENEAMRQQRLTEQQERQPNTYPPPSMGPPSHQHSYTDGNVFKSPEDMAPPPGGWYSRHNQDAEGIALGDPQAPRQLHSDVRKDSAFRQVPEAFRPIEASYDDRTRPIGPPLETGVYSPPTSPVSAGVQPKQPSFSTHGGYYQRPAYGPPRTRLSSYGSNESEVSGESEWQRSGWRRESSSPSISPIQTRFDADGFPPGRNFRVGSITEEMSRSPAKEYNDQQTPWAISLPRPGEVEPRRMSRGPALGMHGGQRPLPPVDYAPSGIGYAEAYPPPNQWQQQRGLPTSPESPSSSMPSSQFDPVTAHAPMFDERPPRGIAGHQRNAYPSPPMSPESQWFYHRAGLNAPSQMQYQSRCEDFDLPRPPRKTSYVRQRMYSYDDDRPTAQPRATSGYSGRRDDPTVGEENVEMRGVSYPGQEWTPGRWN